MPEPDRIPAPNPREGSGPPVHDAALAAVLAHWCRLAPAESAAILQADPGGEVREVRRHSPAVGGAGEGGASSAPAPDWLAASHEALLRSVASGEVGIGPVHTGRDLYGQMPQRHVLLLPLSRCGRPAQCAAFLLHTPTPQALAAQRERLEIALPLVEVGDLRAAVAERARAAERTCAAVEVHAAVLRHGRLAPAAMALCNEVATRWQCDRVGLGLLRGSYVRLRALSHADDFRSNTRLVLALEAAMEECLDQDLEITVPTLPRATAIERAHRELAAGPVPASVASLPLRRDGEPVGVLTLERAADRPITAEDLLSVRLSLELCLPHLLRLASGGWFGAPAPGGRHAPRRALAALSAIAFLAIGSATLVLGRGTHRVDAPFVLKAEVQRVLPAPFDGFLEEVAAEPGTAVAAGSTTLARLSTVELRLQLASARAERAAHLKEASAALSDRDPAAEQIARAQAEKVSARIDLLEHLVSQARVASPIDGTVVVGDLKEKVGAPVRQGDVLFEVAALESLYADAYVPEEEIGWVTPGGTGELAAAAFPTERVRVKVERIAPGAEVVDHRNVFPVRLRLDRRPDWMRPGMEGVTQLEIGTRSYGWIVFHRFVDWLRMIFWF